MSDVLKFLRRQSVSISLSIAALYGFMFFWAWCLNPELRTEPISHPAAELQSILESRDVRLTPENPPVVYVPVDYSEGRTATWYPKNESPILRDMVKAGKLPPVEQRVPEEPLVLEGPNGTGKYGGTWQRIAANRDAVSVLIRDLSNPGLVGWSPQGYPIIPNIAREWKTSDDFKEWIFFLRKGLRWSDGHPFTADDIIFWWEDRVEYFSDKRPEWMRIAGHVGTVEKVDDLTVQFTFPVPYPTFLERFAAEGGPPFDPRHYLGKYHPEKGDQDLIAATMEKLKLTSKRAVYLMHADSIYNPEMPTMRPWIVRTYKQDPPFFYVRNPYYWAVDKVGNQLPYFDQVMLNVRSSGFISSAFIHGEVTMQYRYLQFSDYNLLMSNREKGDYAVYHWLRSSSSIFALCPNINRRIEPGFPATRHKAELLKDKRFRQALSLAIDRREIIQSVWNGIGEPSQISPLPSSPYYHQKLQKAFVEYDPERAGRILDELGLKKRDKEGFRTFPDDSRMLWFIYVQRINNPEVAQFIVDHWSRIGLRANTRIVGDNLFDTELGARRIDFYVRISESDLDPLLGPNSYVAVNSSRGVYASGWSLWYQYGGLYGRPIPDGIGAIELEPENPARRAMELLDEAFMAPNFDMRKDYVRQILDISAENVWNISVSTAPPQLVVVKKGVRNVPKVAIEGPRYGSPRNTRSEVFFFENPTDSPSITAQIKEELTTITPRSKAVKTDASVGPSLGSKLTHLLSWLIGASLFLLLLLTALRHPFIGRRFLIMVPTLIVISIVVFTIIQIPPGNYMSYKLAQANLEGDALLMAEAEQLKYFFPMDKNPLERYISWLGLPWFFSFQEKDAGLLQGNLGRSMETLQPVNEMVGERIILTFFISLGSILFTWVLAIPIGIYSAVRQYTFADYLITLLGFLGMCIPNFLLALLIMYWSSLFFDINVTGLFSPEYAALPGWTWGKVGDLLQHIWVPVILLGVGGTAGMIRVMRGNLLDELKRPYVTTARAKGVRPIRLLFKYPVRLALNPFISGIGGIFPQLVSGGAIVAVVLSLPTVGPLMLQALFTEDLYLAGSMLVVLSILGVFGTLVSDLLLLWLDPRIRMEGGGR